MDLRLVLAVRPFAGVRLFCRLASSQEDKKVVGHMSKLGSMNFKGTSGTVYRFHVYPSTATFKAIGAVYFVTRRFPKTGGGFRHQRVYLGQTADLSKAFDKHNKTDLFEEHSANCICVHQESDPSQRKTIEQDLLPTRNVLLNT